MPALADLGALPPEKMPASDDLLLRRSKVVWLASDRSRNPHSRAPMCGGQWRVRSSHVREPRVHGRVSTNPRNDSLILAIVGTQIGEIR